MRQKLMLFLQNLLWKMEKALAGSSKVGEHVFFEPDQFPWTKELEANWQVIREELEGVLKFREALPNFQDISPDQKSLTTDNLWKTYFFYAFGFKAWNNCKRCPETTRLLKTIPGMKTAFFSILGPHKNIPPHRGPFKGVIRYHLGLIVPEEKTKCRIRVADEIRYWEEGKSMIFDDTYNHEVWNETDEERVVLFVDFVRPLRFPASAFNWLLINAIAISPLVLGAAGNYLVWEKRFEKVANAKPQESSQAT